MASWLATGDADDAAQPGGDDAGAGGWVGVKELKGPGGVGEHGADGEAGEQEGDGVGATVAPGEGIDDGHGEDGAGEGQEGGGGEAEDGELAEEEDADAGADGGAAGGADDVGVGHGVAEEALKHEPGDGERGADEGGGKYAGEPDFKQDSALGGSERGAAKGSGEWNVDGADGEREQDGGGEGEGEEEQDEGQVACGAGLDAPVPIPWMRGSAGPALRLLQFPAFASEVELDAGAEGEGESGIAEGLVIVLAGEVLDVGVEVDARGELIAAAEIDALVAAEEIAVWQQEAVAEVGVGEIGAVIAAGDEGSGERTVPLCAGVIQAEVAGVGCDAEWACALEGGVGADGDAGEVAVGVEAGGGEGVLHDGVSVGVAAADEEVLGEAVLAFKLDAGGEEGEGIDVGAVGVVDELGLGVAELQEVGLGDVLDIVGVLVVEVGDAHAGAAVEELLIDAGIVGAGVFRAEPAVQGVVLLEDGGFLDAFAEAAVELGA